MINILNYLNIDKRKLIISILFGMIGFFLNFISIKIYEFQDIRIDILIGLFFPLVITLVWGWKYGLISAIFGGCQTMWILWYSDGYGMLYSVPIFIVWIVWHGFISDLRKKKIQYEWYYNKYIVEIPIRIIISIGFASIFIWLTSLNPPFWNSGITNTEVTFEWLKLVITKHVIEGYFLLLLADVFLRMNTVKKLLTIDNTNTDNSFIIITSILIGIFVWIADAFARTYFYGSNFLENIIFKIEPYDLLMRLLIIILFIIIGVIFSNLYEKNNNKKIELEKSYNRINSVLKIISNTKETKDTDERLFMTDLLNTAIDIIPEAECGVAYIYKDGFPIPISAIGHDKNILEHKNKFDFDKMFKNLNKCKQDDDIYIIDNFKGLLLESADIQNKDIIREYAKKDKETMFITILLNDEKIASLNFSIPEDSSKSFGEKSIETAIFLKNVPAAFYTKIRNYELKQELFKNMIMSIIKILNLHDPYTEEHSTNVANLSCEIAKKLGMSREKIDIVYWTGLLHDIGKILIADDILNKKGKLTNEEYEIVKKHSIWGYETLRTNDGLSKIATYVLYHHERWDGKGYPEGIDEEKIPLISRIIAVADTYDSMTTDRPYRKALSNDIAIKEIKENAGTQFDPDIVEIFVEEVMKMEKSG